MVHLYRLEYSGQNSLSFFPNPCSALIREFGKGVYNGKSCFFWLARKKVVSFSSGILSNLYSTDPFRVPLRGLKIEGPKEIERSSNNWTIISFILKDHKEQCVKMLIISLS